MEATVRDQSQAFWVTWRSSEALMGVCLQAPPLSLGYTRSCSAIWLTLILTQNAVSHHLKNYVTNLCMAQYITNLMIKWKTHRSSRADICGMKDPSQLKGMNTSTWDKHPPLFFIFASCGSGWHGGPCASSEMQCQCWEYVLHRISVMVQWFRYWLNTRRFHMSLERKGSA